MDCIKEYNEIGLDENLTNRKSNSFLYIFSFNLLTTFTRLHSCPGDHLDYFLIT